MIRCAVYFTETGMIQQISQSIDIESIAAACTSSQSVIEVDENISDHTHYISAGAVMPFPVQPEPAFIWDWVGHSWVDHRTLAQRQATKWESIKFHKDTLESGSFTWEGFTFQINKSNITGAVLDAMLAKAAGEVFHQPWVLTDNARIFLNADQMISVGRAMKGYVSGLSVTGEVLRDRIAAATTTAELDAITWPT